MHWAAGGLEGVRVVEVGGTPSTVFCAHRLASLGADALCVEPPGGRAAPGVATMAFARGHRCRPAAEVDLAEELARADILVDDDRVGPSLLGQLSPDAVRVVVTAFGRNGPYAGFSGTDLTLEAFGGAVSSSGRADRAPIALGGNLVSTYVGAVAAAAALAELRLVRAGGGGSTVDVAAVEALAASMDRRAVQLLTHSYTGWDAQRDRGGASALLNGVHPCRDGWVYVSLYGWHIRTVCELTGDPELAPFLEHPRLALDADAGGPFRRGVLRWLAGRGVHEAVEAAQAVGWPVIPANSLAGALDDPWLVGAGLVAPEGPPGAHGRGGRPVRLPATGIALRSAGHPA